MPSIKLLFILLLLSPLTSQAAIQATDTEIFMLPAYCKARYGKSSPQEIKVWKKRLGHDFMHIHHFCNGLILLNRTYMISDKKKRLSVSNQAFREIIYTQKHAAPNFILQPAIAYYKGKILENLGKNDNAIKEYLSAIKLNPKYINSYVALASLYSQLGLKSDAINTIKKGLKYKPGSKKLKRKLKKLEG